MNTKKRTALKPVGILLAFAIIIVSKFIPASEGLTQAGIQVLGIFAGVLLLWLTVSIDWPSLLCIGALALVPGLELKKLLTVSFGSTTFAFLLFTFLCTYALSQTQFIRRCAVGFVTASVSKKGPWVLTVLFFFSVLFVGAFISPTVLFVVYLPILEEIYALLGIKKGESTASMLMIGLVVCCGLSSGMTPIAHVFPVMALEYYATATGNNISYASYMGFAIPVGLAVFGLMLLVFRFIMKPDMSALKSIDMSLLKKSVKPMDKRELVTLAVFAAVVLMWVMPDFLTSTVPQISKFFSKQSIAFPPLIGAVLLCLLSIKGKPLLNFAEGMSKGIPWGSLVMAGSTLALGSTLSDPDIGLTASLQQVMTPMVSAISPFVVVIIFTLWACVQTNFSSNMVTVTVVTAVAIPICIGTNGAVSTAAMTAVIGMMASFAFAFPPAMPCVAIAGASGWTSVGALAKYGSLIALLSAIVAALLGYPIAKALM